MASVEMIGVCAGGSLLATFPCSPVGCGLSCGVLTAPRPSSWCLSCNGGQEWKGTAKAKGQSVSHCQHVSAPCMHEASLSPWRPRQLWHGPAPRVVCHCALGGPGLCRGLPASPFEPPGPTGLTPFSVAVTWLCLSWRGCTLGEEGGLKPIFTTQTHTGTTPVVGPCWGLIPQINLSQKPPFAVPSSVLGSCRSTSAMAGARRVDQGSQNTMDEDRMIDKRLT